ncbi:MAG: hypothetical protein HGA85_06570 [Nanoarchaeota archaeon]|nr:hypothetical protein [Nanoarchaeota archaeon]
MVLDFFRSLADPLSIYKSIDGRLSVSDRPYKIAKTREDGEKDLLMLALEDEKEAAFIFSEDSGIWYNFRRGGGPVGEYGSQGVDIPINIDLSIFGERLTSYHTHPLKTTIRDTNAKLNSHALTPSQKYAKESGDHSVLHWFQSIVPSIEDADVDITLLGSNLGCYLDFRIVSGFGRTDAAFVPGRLHGHETVIRRYSRAHMEVRAMLEEAYMGRRQKYDGDLERFRTDTVNTINSSMKGMLNTSITLYHDLFASPGL